MNSINQRHQNDVDGLFYVKAFGWMRAPELGGLLWPDNKTSAEAANRVIRSWINRNLVIVRTLPERAGKAVVLSAEGARLLEEEGIIAKSGKDLGVLSGGIWTPSASWKHDLIAVGTIVQFTKLGYGFSTEMDLRRRHPEAKKIPDGLLISPEESSIWLEVEHARKSGSHMRHMAQALEQASLGRAPKMDGQICKAAMVAYCENTDERGYTIDHKARVLNALSKYILQDISIQFVRCSLKGFSVTRIEIQEQIVQSDAVSEVIGRCWDGQGKGAFGRRYEHYFALVTPGTEDKAPCRYCVQYLTHQIGEGEASDTNAAMRACGAVISLHLRSRR